MTPRLTRTIRRRLPHGGDTDTYSFSLPTQLRDELKRQSDEAGMTMSLLLSLILAKRFGDHEMIARIKNMRSRRGAA